MPEYSEWDNCVLGSYCEQPPDAPYEGSITVTPKIMQLEHQTLCAVDGTTVDIKCPTFQQIYIISASYGREQ